MNTPTADPRVIARLFSRLLPVQVLLAAVGAVGGIVSSLFAGNLVGPDAVAAIGLFGPFSMFLGAVSAMLIGGSQILCGKYMGSRQAEHTQGVFSLDLTLTGAFALVMTLLFLLAGSLDLTGFVTGDPAVRPLFNRYLLGQAIGILPMLLGQHLAAFLALERQSKRALIASIACILVNLLLNLVFVRGLGLGAFGLGLAASLGQAAFFLIQARYYLSGRSMLRFRRGSREPGQVRDILRIGTPGAATYGYQTVRRFLVNVLILRYAGSAGMAAFGASDALLGIVWSLPAGILAVSRMLISISAGEEDRQSLADTMRTVVKNAVPLMCIVSAAVILCAEPLTRLYYRDPSAPVYIMTVWAFRILPLCMPLSVLSMNFSCYGQVAGRQFLVHAISLLDGVVCVTGFTALLIPFLGMNSVYISNILNGLVCALVFFLYAWRANLRFPRDMEELMAIPRDFGAAPEDRMDLTLRGMDEVVRVSRQVQEFCLDRGIDRRRAVLAGLCMEEMAGNVVEHGFGKDKKRHTVDARVVYKDGGLILRLRDDCIPFDPAERSAMVDPEDVTKNIGIRMVYAMAKEIGYQNLLGLNVLTIKL